MELTFEDWKSRLEEITKLTTEFNRLPSLGAWHYLYDVSERCGEKNPEQTRMAEHTIAQLRHLIAEFKEKTDAVLGTYWQDKETLEFFKDVDANEGGMTMKLPGLWKGVIEVHQKELNELTDLYSRAFGKAK